MKTLILCLFVISITTMKPVSDLKINKIPIPKTVKNYRSLHYYLSYHEGQGRMFKLEKVENDWMIIKSIDLPEVPYETAITSNNDFLIIGSEKLIKVTTDFEIETLIDNGF